LVSSSPRRMCCSSAFSSTLRMGVRRRKGLRRPRRQVGAGHLQNRPWRQDHCPQQCRGMALRSEQA
jgi:hypothetical protein